MKFAFFDLETAFYTEEQAALAQSDGKLLNIWDIWPFGVSVAAIKLSDREEPEVWYDAECSTVHAGEFPWEWEVASRPSRCWSERFTREFVDRLEQLDREGYALTTWNGTGFDFQLLYRMTLDPVLKAICWRHIDPCFQMLCMRGFPVGLEAAAVEVGGRSKEENGISAPILWAEGNYERVIRYVKGDVIRLETVVREVCKSGGLRWRTKAGALRFQPFSHLYTVRECMQMPMPDTSWMTPDPDRGPITRPGTMGWMIEEGELKSES